MNYKELKTLTKLYIGNTQVTKSALKKLKEALPKCDVVHVKSLCSLPSRIHTVFDQASAINEE